MILNFNKAYSFFSTLSVITLLLAKISPVYFWVFGLLAFLIPIILSLHFIGLLSFVFFRRKIILLSLVVLLTGINHINSSIGVGYFKKKTSAVLNKSLTILTHNLGSYSFHSNSNGSYSSQMNFRQYDVICFQEFVKSNSDSTIQNLAKTAGIEDYSYVFTGKKMTPKNFGLLIFSRYPIINSGKIAFGLNSFNGVSYVDIKIKTDTIRVYNSHFKSYNLKEAKSITNYLQRIKGAIVERTSRAEEVLTHISNAKHPVILVGDLNEHPYGYVYNQFVNKLNDAISGTTYIFPQTVSKFPARIDYIFVDRRLNVIDFGILKTILISDHFPVYSRVEY